MKLEYQPISPYPVNRSFHENIQSPDLQGYLYYTMPYIIDGHNLIPKIPGINLGDIDDEVQLIKMLQDFCRLRRTRVEVYFDNAPPGEVQDKKHGQVSAILSVKVGQQMMRSGLA